MNYNELLIKSETSSLSWDELVKLYWDNPADRAANEILETLMDRKGFEYWWVSIGEEDGEGKMIQDEIFHKLGNIFRKPKTDFMEVVYQCSYCGKMLDGEETCSNCEENNHGFTENYRIFKK